LEGGQSGHPGHRHVWFLEETPSVVATALLKNFGVKCHSANKCGSKLADLCIYMNL